MPARERMIALTPRMYDMTRKFVMPPRTSVPIVEPAARTWNCRSIQSVLPPTAAVRAAMSPSSATLTPTREKSGCALVEARVLPGPRGAYARGGRAARRHEGCGQKSSMRFAVTPILALVLTLGPSSRQASAVVGYDSDYAGESAFLNIAPGPSQPFQVFFKN